MENRPPPSSSETLRGRGNQTLQIGLHQALTSCKRHLICGGAILTARAATPLKVEIQKTGAGPRLIIVKRGVIADRRGT